MANTYQFEESLKIDLLNALLESLIWATEAGAYGVADGIRCLSNFLTAAISLIYDTRTEARDSILKECLCVVSQQKEFRYRDVILDELHT